MLPATALAISVAVVLVAFVLMIVRRDVVSQAIGFLSLENGISLTALVVAAGLPLILEVAFLFDLLVAAVVFGLLIRVHHGRAESMSTADLTSCGVAMNAVLLLLLTLPLAAAVICLRAPLAVARAITAVSGVACFGLVLALVPGRRAP